MKHNQNRLALPSIEQERGWPSRIGTRLSRYLKELDLCSFAVIALQDPTEFALATNTSFRLWDEGRIQDSVVSTDTAMGPLLVIMFEPHANDVVELSFTEADEIIQLI